MTAYAGEVGYQIRPRFFITSAGAARVPYGDIGFVHDAPLAAHAVSREVVDKLLTEKLQGIMACRLGTSLKDKLLLVTYYAGVRANRKLGRAYFAQPRSVSVSYKDITFEYAVANLDDYRILEEMFINRQYALDIRESVTTIVDLGSNVGTSIIYFLAEYPHARIYGFEPTAYCFERLQKTVKRYRLE